MIAHFAHFIRAVSILALSLGYATAHAAGSETSTVLLKTERAWDGGLYQRYPTGQPELTVLKSVIPAHTQLPWHTHPAPNATYILSGTLTVESKDGKFKKTFKSGEALASPVNTVRRGVTGDQPVELITFYAGTPNEAAEKVAK